MKAELNSKIEEASRSTNQKIEEGQKENQKNMELLREEFNNQINETNRRMEDGQKKTEELLEKKMAIMKEDLSAELGEKIDQTNQKIDEINAKFNRDVETIQADHERIWQQISAVSYTHLDVYKRQYITLTQHLYMRVKSAELFIDTSTIVYNPSRTCVCCDK